MQPVFSNLVQEAKRAKELFELDIVLCFRRWMEEMFDDPEQVEKYMVQVEQAPPEPEEEPTSVTFMHEGHLKTKMRKSRPTTEAPNWGRFDRLIGAQIGRRK